MRCASLFVVAMLVSVLAGCATSETAAQAWQRATYKDSVAGYQTFLGDYPNSEYDAQAKAKLQEAQQRQKNVLKRISQEAEKVRAAGGKTWTLQVESSGREVVLYEGMSYDDVETALGGSISPFRLGFPLTVKSHLGVTFDFDDKGQLRGMQNNAG